MLGAGCSAVLPSELPSAGALAEWLISRGAGVEGQALEDIAEDAWDRGGWEEFAQLLPIDQWRARPTNDIVRVLAELCREGLVSRIVTTNWDLLMEGALSQIGQPFAKVVDADSLAIEPAGRVTLIKLNGCIDHPRRIKATRSQIESPEWIDRWANALFDVLVRTNSLLFAGYSGATRAATTTIARIVEMGERHAGDFVVDRQSPEQMAAASETGEEFMEAIDTVGVFTGDATDFSAALRAAVYPLLLAEPAEHARAMAADLVVPTVADADRLTAPIESVVLSFKDAGAHACQRWLRLASSSSSECEHAAPYVPLLPNATELAKCFLGLAAVRWADRLSASPEELILTLTVQVDGRTLELPLVIAMSDADQRRDTGARAAVANAARDDANSAGPVAIGVAFGGFGHVDDEVMTSFSAARGAQLPNAVRGTRAAAVGWIDSDSLFGAFAQDADEAAIQATIREHLDSAAGRALAPNGE